MKRILTILVAVTFVPAVHASPPSSRNDTFASVPSSPAQRDEKEQLKILLMALRAHEYKPTLRLMRRIGTDAQMTRLLVRVSDNNKLRPTVRVRALATLYLFPTKDVQKYLLSVVHERENIGTRLGTLLRKQALRTLGMGYGAEMVVQIAALKDDPNAQIREGCAIALGDTKSRKALPYLQAWLPNEDELFVRLAIDRAIDGIRKRSR